MRPYWFCHFPSSQPWARHSSGSLPASAPPTDNSSHKPERYEKIPTVHPGHPGHNHHRPPPLGPERPLLFPQGGRPHQDARRQQNRPGREDNRAVLCRHGRHRPARPGGHQGDARNPRSPLDLFRPRGDKRTDHPPRREFLRHRHTVQHAQRHPVCDSDHIGRPLGEGRHTPRRPAHTGRRLDNLRRETPEFQRDKDSARSQRHACQPQDTAQGGGPAHRLPRGAWRHPGVQHRRGIHGRPDHRIHTPVAILRVNPKGDFRGHGQAAQAGHEKPRARPPGQRRRPARVGNRPGRAFPQPQRSGGLHQIPDDGRALLRYRPRRRVQRRPRGGAGQPVLSLGQWNHRRGHTGPWPRSHRGPPHIRQRARAAPLPLPRRLDDTPDRVEIPHPLGPLHPEALQARQQRRIPQGHTPPLRSGGILLGRLHTLLRLRQVLNAPHRAHRLWRRGRDARRVCRGRHHRILRLLPRPHGKRNPQPVCHLVCRRQPQAANPPVRRHPRPIWDSAQGSSQTPHPDPDRGLWRNRDRRRRQVVDDIQPAT